MPVDQWRELVLKYIRKLDATGFAKEVVGKARTLASEDDLQEMLVLANNIWNNTPQSDRGGMSPYQLVQLQSRARKPAPRQKKAAPRRQKGWHFDPDRGGEPVPELVKRRTEQRIRRYAEQNFAGRYTHLDVRFRGQFCYVDAYQEPEDLSDNWPPAD